MLLALLYLPDAHASNQFDDSTDHHWQLILPHGDTLLQVNDQLKFFVRREEDAHLHAYFYGTT